MLTIYEDFEKYKSADFIYEKLKKCGFKGKVLRDLFAIVQGETDFEKFLHFVEKYREETRMNSHLLYIFRLHIIDSDEPISQKDFCEKYITGTMECKTSLLEGLAKESVSTREVEQIDRLIDSGKTTLEVLHSVIINNRKENSIRVIINLL